MLLRERIRALLALAVLAPAMNVAWAGAGHALSLRDERLVSAVRGGDVESASRLLAKRADPDLVLADGSTLLSWAVESQDAAMVRLLIEHKAKVDGAGDGSTAPLIIACQYGDPAVIDLLLSARANVKVSRPDGIAPLALCAGSAPAEVVRRLIAAGAEADRADEQGQTPLMWAAAKGRIDNIRVLLESGAQINKQTHSGFTPLFFALKSGNPAAPIAILEAGGNPDHIGPEGTTVVQMAMYQKDYAFAARMIERGADVKAFDRGGNTLLHAAVLANQPDLVKLLLAKGADPNKLTGPSKVEYRYEVNFKSDPYEVPPKPPLMLAAENGFAEVMQLLADGGADINYRWNDGTNVVLAAAMSGKLAALDVALTLLPDPNTVDRRGQTPLHLILQGDGGPDTQAMMKLLADKGARVNIKNRGGRTAADAATEAQSGPKAAFLATFGERSASL